jgi:hypothetical protein
VEPRKAAAFVGNAEQILEWAEGGCEMPRHSQNGSGGPEVQAVLDHLHRNWKKLHPKAKIDAYRIYPFVIRVRIIDPDFRGIDWVDRHHMVWKVFEGPADEIASQVLTLVLVTPGERRRDPNNLEFENPIVYPL